MGGDSNEGFCKKDCRSRNKGVLNDLTCYCRPAVGAENPCITRVNSARPRLMRKSFLLPLLLTAAAYLGLPMPGLSSSIQQKIGATQNKIAGKKRQEGVLTTQVTGYNLRIRSLQGEINGLQQRQDRVQGELNTKQAELDSIRNRLQIAQDRLTRLRARPPPPPAPAPQDGPARARRAARRALQGRRARHGHGRARVERLRRPAR